MIFVSYKYIARYGDEWEEGFDNVMLEDVTIEPKNEDDLYKLNRIVEKDLEERKGYYLSNVKILWWKIL